MWLCSCKYDCGLAERNHHSRVVTSNILRQKVIMQGRHGFLYALLLGNHFKLLKYSILHEMKYQHCAHNACFSSSSLRLFLLLKDYFFKHLSV